MSYRDNEPRWWSAADQFTLPYMSARLGFGLVAIAVFLLVSGDGVIASGITALLGAALLLYGLRDY